MENRLLVTNQLFPRYRYYVTSLFDETEAFEVNEQEFWDCVGSNRVLIPMEYSDKDINRQDFYSNGSLIAFRIKQRGM